MKTVLLSLLCVCAIYGQSAAVNGSIDGIVRDPANALVSNAIVKARDLDTNFSLSTQTNEAGEFEIRLLPLGRYEVSIAAPGFAEFVQSPVDIAVGRIAQLTIALSLSTEKQSVAVTADASIVRTGSVDVENLLNSRDMQNQPVTSRNTQNIALFTPGIAGMRDDEFGTTQFAFGGMQRRAFQVDGADNTQRGGQLRLGIFNLESISEVQVIANAYSAEYGRTVGGIVNMVTRGGTNEVHGEGLYLARRPGLIARPSLAALKPFQQWTTYSGNIGGPILKDRVFYFFSGEYEPLDAPNPITISPANAAALSLPASELGAAPFGQRFQTYLGRIDFRVNAKNFGFVRFDYFYTHSHANSNAGGLNEKTFSNDYIDRQNSGTAQFTSILTPALVNEFRFADERRTFFRPPESGMLGASILISGVANLGTGTSANQFYLEHQNQVIDNVLYTVGRHGFKFGTDISTINVQQVDRLALTFQFNGAGGVSPLQQYLNTSHGGGTGAAFTYSILQQTFGNNSADHRTQSYNFFAQDDFRMLPNLTLNLGIRYEYLQYPSLNASAPLIQSRSIAEDPHEVAPRLGFSWAPGLKTVVRGGYGLFYDTTNLRLIGAAIRGSGVAVQNISVSGTAAGAPVFPNPLQSPGGFTAALPNTTFFSPDFTTLYAHQANLQIEHEITPNLSITAGYQFYGGHHLPLVRDINLSAPAGHLADGRPIYDPTNRPDKRFAQENEIESVGNSVYNGAFFAVTKRYGAGLQFTASYTYSVAINDTDGAGDTGTPVSDPSNIKRDRGLSSSDLRHRFVFEAVWQPRVSAGHALNLIVNGWLLAPNVTAQSGFPITAVAGQDLNHDLNNNDLPLFRGRNNVDGPGFHELNLRFARIFNLYRERVRFQVIGEAENLLNSTNAACGISGCTGAVVNVASAQDFGRVVAALHSRQVQVGGRIQF
jgi:hypothetical protein